MNVTVQTQAVLLLTAWFSKPGKNDPRPLTPKEWGRFARWLKDNELAPEALITNNDPLRLLNGWSDRSITPERIVCLLQRAGALGFVLEKWQRAGLWVVTRSDVDYPSRLKKRLKFDSPPILFGCGNRQLLDRGGIAVIGSRDATEADLAFTTRLGGEIALDGRSVISGGARGVDETAMLAALGKEGTVVGILADSLLRSATSAKYRNGLMAKNLLLISPFSPEAGFDVGNAMARNKYIYCLADAAVVVATGKDKGGTWTGAVENLKQGWVPLWVKPHPDAQSGNAALMERGACSLPEGILEIGNLITPNQLTALPQTNPLNTSIPFNSAQADIPKPAPYLVSVAGDRAGAESPGLESRTPAEGSTEAIQADSLSLYDMFLVKLAVSTRTEPMTPEVLTKRLEVNKAQLNDWLKRALADGKVTKLNKPVRYQTAEAGQCSLAL